MILGFKQQFTAPILAETKRHTIREDKKNRWKAGRYIQMAIGVRTKKYFQFAEAICTGTQKINIYHNKYAFVNPRIFIDGIEIFDTKTKELIAKNDGFENLEQFFKWFNKDFEGKIIHWTNLKY